KKYIQHNKQPLLMLKDSKDRYDRNEQAKSFITQELCLKNSNEKYAVPKKPENVIRIMTYNVHFWQGPQDNYLYEFNGKKYKYYYTGDDIVNVIKVIEPDILCLQEIQRTNYDDGTNTNPGSWGVYIDWNGIKNKLQTLGYIIDESKNYCSA